MKYQIASPPPTEINFKILTILEKMNPVQQVWVSTQLYTRTKYELRFPAVPQPTQITVSRPP